MKKHLSLILFLSILVSGCSQEELSRNESVNGRTFTASFEQNESRTYIEDSKHLRWTTGDLISLFNSNTLNQQYKFDGKTGDNSGTFSKVETVFGTGNDLNCHYAVYPYASDIAITENGVITATLPSKQSYAENSFGLGVNTMAAVTKNTDDTFLKFKNVGGYLKLQLYGDNVTVKSITLTGNNNEKLAGTATITSVYGQDPTISMADDATGSVTLDCGEGVEIGSTAETATAFWMVVPPTTFEKGFEVTITDVNDNEVTKSTSNEISIARNTIKPMPAFEVETQDIPYIIFKADSEQTLTMSKAIATLEYSVNGGEWKELGINTVEFGGSLGNMKIRGKSSIGTSTSPSTNSYATIGFGNETKVSCSGDIRTLIDYEAYNTVNTSNARFCYLFHNCSNLITAPQLPAMDLATQCYKYMFQGCTSLSKAPELPAVKMRDECYGGMFWDCTSLSEPPQLPATQLAGWCYYYMFYGCTSLTNAPTLSVETLADYCYHSMFEGCTSLTKAPNLPARILTDYCYAYMFHGCTNLTSTPYLSATTLVEGCYWHMFSNCSKLNKIAMLATDASARYCLSSWVSGVSSTGVFIKAGGMVSLTRGDSGIPNGWKVEDHGID